MHNCEFNRKDSAKTIYVGNKSTLTLPADGSFCSGGRGKLAPFYGIDVVPGGIAISGAPGEGLPAANTPLKSDTRGWQSLKKGAAEVVWVQKMRTIQVTVTGGGQGVKNNYVARYSIVSKGTLVHFSGHITSTQVVLELAIVLKNNQWRVIQSDIKADINAYYRMQGDESSDVVLLTKEDNGTSGKFCIDVFKTVIY